MSRHPGGFMRRFIVKSLMLGSSPSRSKSLNFDKRLFYKDTYLVFSCLRKAIFAPKKPYLGGVKVGSGSDM